MRFFGLRACLLVVCSITLNGCRTLTSNEVTFLDSVFLTETSGHKVELGSVRVSCISSDDALKTSVKRQLRSDLAVTGQLKVKGVSYDVDQLTAASIKSLLDGNGLTIGNNIYFKGEFCRPDLADGYPAVKDMRFLPRLAHEVTHVWQFQNKELTGYSFLKIVIERVGRGDEAYLYKPLIPGKPFLKYRFEQQGQIVEDYVILKETGAPEAEVYRRLISQAFDVDLALRKMSAESE